MDARTCSPAFLKMAYGVDSFEQLMSLPGYIDPGLGPMPKAKEYVRMLTAPASTCVIMGETSRHTTPWHHVMQYWTSQEMEWQCGFAGLVEIINMGCPGAVNNALKGQTKAINVLCDWLSKTPDMECGGIYSRMVPDKPTPTQRGEHYVALMSIGALGLLKGIFCEPELADARAMVLKSKKLDKVVARLADIMQNHRDRAHRKLLRLAAQTAASMVDDKNALALMLKCRSAFVGGLTEFRNDDALRESAKHAVSKLGGNADTFTAAAEPEGEEVVQAITGGSASSGNGQAAASSSDNACAACGVSGVPLKKCGKCRTTRYCGAECQRKDFKTHKKTCKSPDAAPPAV